MFQKEWLGEPRIDEYKIDVNATTLGDAYTFYFIEADSEEEAIEKFKNEYSRDDIEEDLMESATVDSLENIEFSISVEEKVSPTISKYSDFNNFDYDD